MKGEYHEYTKTYRKKLDKLCSQIGIDSHAVAVFDKEYFKNIDAKIINNKLLEMFHAGQTFGYKNKYKSKNLLEKILDTDKELEIRLYENTTDEKNEEQKISPQEILLDMYSSFNYGIGYSSIFKKRMMGREFLERLEQNSEIKKIYKLQQS